jgi:hypothetical protein
MRQFGEEDSAWYPGIVEKNEAYLNTARTESKQWPLVE